MLSLAGRQRLWQASVLSKQNSGQHIKETPDARQR